MITNRTVSHLICVFLSLLLQVNCQICDSTIPYDRCSTSSACGCFSMVGAQDVSVCGFLWKFCSQLVPCGSSQDCSEPEHICVRHHRCISTVTTTTTTTMKTETTTKRAKFNKWQRYGRIIAGGNGHGFGLNQLYIPAGFSIGRNKTVFIADLMNHRVVQWISGTSQGNVTAGGNGIGNKTEQLTSPIDVLVDEQSNSSIIADRGNRRLIQWFN
ncbi:unnamed protein product [Adineta ricciae]|uniref:Uncharacterized protein n=1 Tax=Adineta ricciae TaxID=249248 RepID=A0A815P757_ADIRI|nr:unnamed protein product [Adineta ricciae]